MKPKVSDEQCRALYELLIDGNWYKARQIPMNDRLIRACCAEKPEHFLSSQQGYKITAKATIGEIDVAVADLRSRIIHLDKRAGALECVAAQRHTRQMRYG